MDKSQSIGEKIRSIRLSQGITINYVASKTNLTPSFISQFERGLTKASVASMQKIAKALNTPLFTLFENGTDEFTNSKDVRIIRKQNRKKLVFPAPGNTVDYLLTGESGKLEVIYSKIEPGGESGELYTHNSEEECIIVLHGKMEVTVGQNSYTLIEGDTITYSSRTPHGWKNVGTKPLEVIWVITPPSF